LVLRQHQSKKWGPIKIAVQSIEVMTITLTASKTIFTELDISGPIPSPAIKET
jgi:hypothetical protein